MNALPGIEEKVDRYLDPYLEMNDFSGTVLIARNGDVLVRKGYGLADHEWNVPNSPQTKYHIASLSKPFTAAAIVLLEKRGQLGFDDPLANYLPGFQHGDQITIAHLLTHRSGLPDFFALPAYGAQKTQPLAFSDWIALLKMQPLDFMPGTQSGYSNSGYALLAAVIEKVSGESYAEYLHRGIFAPLGMVDTGTWDDTRIIPQRASGYEPWLAGFINSPYYEKSVLVGSGSLYSTVDDLYTWYRAIHAGSLYPIDSTPYPYGWGVRQRFGRLLIEQGGNDPGFVSNLSAYLKDDVCIIVTGNLRTGAIDIIKDDLGAIIFNEDYEIPAVRKTIAVDPTRFDDYTGQYEVSPTMTLTVKTDGEHLLLKGTGGYFLPLEPLSEMKFFYRQFYVPIVFEMDENGRVAQLLWAGQYPCKKL